MPDIANPYATSSTEQTRLRTALADQDVPDPARSHKRFASGAVLTVLSVATMLFAIHGMRAGLVELSTAVGAPAVPRKPSEIASEMMFSGWIGYVAAAVSLTALLMMVSGYRRASR